MPEPIYIPTNSIRDDAERILTAIEPGFMRGLKFQRATYDAPLNQHTYKNDFDGTRKIHVLTGPLAGVRGVRGGDWQGTTVIALPQYISVQVRYQVPPGNDGHLNLVRYTSHDENAIIYHLQPSTGFWTPSVKPAKCDPTGNSKIAEIKSKGQDNGESRAYILDIKFEIYVNVGLDS